MIEILLCFCTANDLFWREEYLSSFVLTQLSYDHHRVRVSSSLDFSESCNVTGCPMTWCLVAQASLDCIDVRRPCRLSLYPWWTSMTSITISPVRCTIWRTKFMFFEITIFARATSRAQFLKLSPQHVLYYLKLCTSAASGVALVIQAVVASSRVLGLAQQSMRQGYLFAAFTMNSTSKQALGNGSSLQSDFSACFPCQLNSWLYVLQKLSPFALRSTWRLSSPLSSSSANDCYPWYIQHRSMDQSKWQTWNSLHKQ